MSRWTHIMIHSTFTGETEVTPEMIYQWHIKERGWSRVGYSMLIQRTGHLKILAPFDRSDFVDYWEITNGAKGWNGRARHVALAGGRGPDGQPHANFNVTQQEVLYAVCRLLIMQHPQLKVIGHNQVHPTKACPSFHVPHWALDYGIQAENIDFKDYAKNKYYSPLKHQKNEQE